uniref:DDE-1 domain-containing protein n=1 Tax=Hyaloperonospora arabidopsidis (strain Emoy2) TaxID=559515 RepID=M4BTK2_HYAAE
MHGRRVLLLLDNASCHYGAAECYNVSWHSSRQTRQYICNRSTQVCLNGCSPDQQFLTFFLLGIMWSFKARYRKKFVRWLLDAFHTRIDRKLDILEDVHFTILSWEEVPEQVICNCWRKCVIVGAVTMDDLTQLCDYNKSINRYAEDELTKLMKGSSCGFSVGGYIDADDDESIKCDSDVIEHEAIENDNDGDSADGVTIGHPRLYTAVSVLSSFLPLQHE